MRCTTVIGGFAMALALVLTGATSSAGAPRPHAPAAIESGGLAKGARPVIGLKGCSTSAWKYRSTSRKSKQLRQFGPVYSHRNRTKEAATMTVTAQIGGTATATFSGSTNVKASAKLAEISGTFGIQASLSLTASIGQSVTTRVGPGKTGYAKYGVFSLPVKGTEQRVLAPDCRIQSRASATVAPFEVGWETWTK